MQHFCGGGGGVVVDFREWREGSSVFYEGGG